MNVVLDVTALMRTGLTGIGVYVRALWHELSAMPGVELTGQWRASRFGRRALIRRHIEGRTGPRLPLLSGLNLRGYDVFHGPDFRIPNSGDYRKVVTIHDLVVAEPGLVDERFAREGLAKLARTLVAQRPERVIAISAFTRSRIVERFAELEARIDVVPMGVDFERFAGAGAAHRRAEGRPYILSVGSVEKRKNLAMTIAAFTLAREAEPDLELVIVGGGGHGSAEIDALIEASPHRSAIRRLGFVEEAALPDLYRNATCFLYPSLYEGFGLPILEAMAAGTPVITSNFGAMAETAGDAAILADPHSVEAIAAAMLQAIGDTAARERLVAAGRARASAFTWRRTAELTLDVYFRACGYRPA